MENVNNGNGQVPQQGPQVPQGPQAPQGQQPPQYPQQAAQRPQYTQYPQGQYPPYGAVPPKKKSVWPKVLIGCGIVAIAIFVAIIVAAVLDSMHKFDENNIDRTTPLIEELNLTESYVQRDGLDSVQIKKLIYVSMPKDSVLMALGKPDDYCDAYFGDDVIYNINDSIRVEIYFKNDCVSHLDFTDYLPDSN
ncbi:MAG: hypothetical protein J6S96_08880 [Muribaculaceae bacterium]|nr:hypothetical protein [Muribaculaceae bacterium]